MPHVVWRPEVSERSDSKFFNAYLSILLQRPYSCRVRNEPFFFPSVYHELFLSYHFLSVVYPRSSVATNRRQTVTVYTIERRFSFHQPSNRELVRNYSNEQTRSFGRRLMVKCRPAVARWFCRCTAIRLWHYSGIDFLFNTEILLRDTVLSFLFCFSLKSTFPNDTHTSKVQRFCAVFLVNNVLLANHLGKTICVYVVFHYGFNM